MTTINSGGSAFPFGQTDRQTGQLVNGWGSEGMSLRQYAAIHLAVPNSGTDWLDDMIRNRMRDELAAKAMQGLISAFGKDEFGVFYEPKTVAINAYEMVDAMLKEREK